MIDTRLVQDTAAMASSPSPSPRGELDYGAFLKLLIEQLRAQDPTRPVDPAEYVAQLAQFSNVEQAVRANQKLDTLLAASSLTSAGSMIGRTVTSPDGAVTGTVSGVRIEAGTNVAILEDGRELPLSQGVIVA
jgi:flagellar basal-body rod modification protein FlgD